MIKKYGIGIAAFLIAVAAVAFTPRKAAVIKRPSTLVFFNYVSPGAHNATSSYTLASPQPVGDPCAFSNTLCGIWGTDDGTAAHRPTAASLLSLEVAPYYNSGTSKFVLEKRGSIEFKQ